MNGPDYWNDATAQSLYRFLHRWLRAHPDWAWETQDWNVQLRDASKVADDLLQEIEFEEVSLADWLRSPDGQMIRAVVSWLLPGVQGATFDLLADAIVLAARAKRNNQRVVAAGLTLFVVALCALPFLSDRGTAMSPH